MKWPAFFGLNDSLQQTLALMAELTPSQENYLEHILRLSEDGPVRVREIAAACGVKLPSVTRAVGKLAERGFVRHQAYGKVEITPAGARAAEAVVRRDDCLMGLLVDVLAMEKEAAKVEVCRLEHVLDIEVLSRLEVLVSHALEANQQSWLRALQRKIRTRQGRLRQKKGAQVGTAKLHTRSPGE